MFALRYKIYRVLVFLISDHFNAIFIGFLQTLKTNFNPIQFLRLANLCVMLFS